MSTYLWYKMIIPQLHERWNNWTTFSQKWNRGIFFNRRFKKYCCIMLFTLEDTDVHFQLVKRLKLLTAQISIIISTICTLFSLLYYCENCWLHNCYATLLNLGFASSEKCPIWACAHVLSVGFPSSCFVCMSETFSKVCYCRATYCIAKFHEKVETMPIFRNIIVPNQTNSMVFFWGPGYLGGIEPGHMYILLRIY